MRHFSLVVLPVFLLAACGSPVAKNPDPNHTHADFAVWIDGKQIDFSGEQYMSGNSNETVHKKELSEYFHLHDGNAYVLHRHKPGLSLSDFFGSLPAMSYTNHQFTNSGVVTSVRLFVNGKETADGSAYVFSDLDHLLITDATDPAEIEREQGKMTDNACLYSKTCPERGKAPTEGCIADPTVPCKL